MPTLTWRSSNGDRTVYSISKAITTIGSDASNDVAIEGMGLDASHARIVFEGRDFNLTAGEGGSGATLVNGRRKRKARLGHEDRLTFGEAEISFSLLDVPSRKTGDEALRAELDGLRKLQQFSAKLVSSSSLSELLEELMDSVIGLTDAAKGFLVLFQDGEPVIEVARNIHRENMGSAVAELSDSIVARVIETREPIIVSDAKNDDKFSNAESVIDMGLSSVMCVPLLERGRLLGLIYVGNNSITGLFEQSALELLRVFASQASLLLQSAMLLDELRVRNSLLSEELNKQRFGDIIGSSPSMLEVFRKVEKVASTEVSVLISGETGTGKELIAHEVHRRSARSVGPFVTVNCGAIPENLMESEFFGHVRGAFTGAVATREGKFQAANKGTIFLDEIGEMPLSLQVKLLRVLQEHQVVKVGATKPDTLDIRVLAATNRDLDREVQAGRFREDLFYRLNVVHIDLPPIRDRGEDLVLLARYLLQRYSGEYGAKVKGFTPNAIIAMRKYAWPGNVRELENRIKKAVILCEGTMIGPKDLDLSEEDLEEVLPLAEARERFQRDYVLRVLERNGGNRAKTAEELDVDPRTIYRYLERS